MSHVAHKDVAVMTIASFLGIMAALLVRFETVATAVGKPAPSSPREPLRL